MAELLIVLTIIVVFIAYRAMSKQQAIRSAKQAAELSVVRNAVEEDVVAFGEDLSRLGNELPSGRLDEGGRADYRRALDAYEAA